VAAFEVGRAELKPFYRRRILKQAMDLSETSFTHIVIEGHTDSTGSDETNRVLSIKRAEAVYNAFLEVGIPADKLSFVGFGSTMPISSNATPEGREANRRVDIYVE
ncbi:MAG: OmpA family protein, partial [Elusimicrobiota bacterium]|nr:OmpA family protein [Elusimicrobiota bacterium]